MSLSHRLDAIVSRLAKAVSLPVEARLALEESAEALIVAERMTKKDEMEMKRAQKKHARLGQKLWEAVTHQPAKDRHGHYVGFATFHWQKDSEKKKHSARINVGSKPARITIKSRDLVVKPHGGEEYVWGAEHEEKAKEKEGPAETAIKLDPHLDENNDGVTDAARVGIPGMQVIPPPALPKLPGELPEGMRKIEADFNEAIERAPEAMAKRYSDVVLEAAKKKDEPPTFCTDDVKFLHPSYLPEGLGPKDVAPQEVMDWRAKNHVLLHQGSNAVAKRAFLTYLDDLAKLPEGDPKRSVLVTSGGCASGKGFAIKNGPGPVKQLKEMAGAVWDAAGEENAVENPWILEECKKRGIKAHFMFADADPVRQWDHPDLGCVSRAAKPGEEGRMVDARLFADSYAIGAKNFRAFHDKFKDDPDVGFTFINTWDMAEAKDKEGKPILNKDGTPKKFPVIKQVDGLDDRSLKIDGDDLYATVTDRIQKSAPTPAIKEGATIGQKLWGPPKKAEGEKTAASVQALPNNSSIPDGETIMANDSYLKDLQKRLLDNFKGNLKKLNQFFKDQEESKRESFADQGLEYDKEGKLVLKGSKNKVDGSVASACDCEQTADNWQAEDCENYDESQDVCLDDVSDRADLVTEAVSECAVPARVKALMEEAASAVSMSSCPDCFDGDTVSYQCAAHMDPGIEWSFESQAVSIVKPRQPVSGASVRSVPTEAFADYGSMLNFLRSLKKGEVVSVFFKKGESSPIQVRVLVVTQPTSETKGNFRRTTVFLEDKKPIKRPLQVGGPAIFDYGPHSGLMFQPTMNQKIMQILGLGDGEMGLLNPGPDVMPTMKPAMASSDKVEAALASALDAITAASSIDEAEKAVNRYVKSVDKLKKASDNYDAIKKRNEEFQKTLSPSGKEYLAKLREQMAKRRDKRIQREEAKEGRDPTPREYKKEHGKCPPGFVDDGKSGCKKA